MRKFNLILLLSLFLLTNSMYSQTYSETFPTNNKGIIQGTQFSSTTMGCPTNDPTSCYSYDFTDINWTITGNLSGIDDEGFKTVGGVMSGTDVDDEVCWVSPLLNLTGAANISVDLTWTFYENGDYIRAEYELNGSGSWSQFGGISIVSGGGEQSGGNTAMASSIGVLGNTLKVRVCGDNNVGTGMNIETFTLDNVSVTNATVASSCPTLTAAPANVTISNSTCQPICTVSGGSITAPSTPCPSGSTIQYNVNNGGWSATLPVYAPSQSIQTRCICTADALVFSPASTAVVTMPGTCTNPPVSITGANPICVGSTTTLSPTTGGTWSSSNAAVAIVTNSGVVTGVSGGSATFTFTASSTGCISLPTSAVTVTARPFVNITGANPICVGSTTTLSPTSGGTWASSNAAVATVTNAGVVTGVSGGTATFTFIQTSTTCSSLPTSAVTVNALPVVSITGANPICVGSTTSLSPTSGGTWASSNAGVATVTNAGVVTGVSGGTATFTFTQTSTSCSSLPTSAVTVNALPVVSITGANPICVGSTTSLSPTSGGTWSSSNAAVATVTNAGVVTGVSGGTATFTFIQTSTTCSSLPTSAVTVNALPTVSITGANPICVGSTTTLSPTSGGTWASSNAVVATVTNAGVVTGVSGGTATFIFTQTSTTCSSLPTSAITVNALPTVSITGANPIFVGNTTTLSPTTGGTWASSNAAVASVTNAGVVTGVAGGTATFTFTQTSPNCSSLPTSIVTVQEGLFQNTTSNMLFTTLQDAIDAATPGQTIMLLGDVSEPNVNISNSVTINANGFTLTIPSGNLTIPVGNSLIWPSNNLIVALGANIVNNGTLCNNGIIDYNNPSAWTNTGLYKGTGTFNGSFTNNGTFSPGN